MKIIRQFVEWILSVLFPVRLGQLDSVDRVNKPQQSIDPHELPASEDGVVVTARGKRYRDAIDRHWSEREV
jgi:hypothetical protein